ncbi:MAG: IS630 family transposase [Verrucomicrobiota bacterium]
MVFIDETGLNTKMSSPCGWAPSSSRCMVKTPHGHWKSSTFIGALRAEGMTAPWLLDGAMNGESFLCYVKTQLAPVLRRGDIVVCDNLSSHKVSGVREAIESAGAELLYLPPYSPDLNPIEMAFAKLKSLLRKASARTFETLVEALGEALPKITPSDCRAFCKHANYAAIKEKCSSLVCSAMSLRVYPLSRLVKG